MTSRPAAAIDARSDAATYDDNEQPTRRLPVLTLATLAEEARRIDAARAGDEDATVTLGAAENMMLLASAFALGRDGRRDAPSTDDEPTLDAPAPVLPAPPAPVLSMAVSGTRPRVTAEMARAAREACEEDRRRREGTFAIRLPERSTENLVVAGIWATAVSLFAVLMLMATSA